MRQVTTSTYTLSLLHCDAKEGVAGTHSYRKDEGPEGCEDCCVEVSQQMPCVPSRALKSTGTSTKLAACRQQHSVKGPPPPLGQHSVSSGHVPGVPPAPTRVPTPLPTAQPTPLPTSQPSNIPTMTHSPTQFQCSYDKYSNSMDPGTYLTQAHPRISLSSGTAYGLAPIERRYESNNSTSSKSPSNNSTKCTNTNNIL